MSLHTHTHARARARTQTSGRKLKIIFLEVLDYSEYSDISKKKKFHENIASSVRKQNVSFFVDCN